MIDLPKKYNLLIKAFLSFFGLGFFPFSPGTITSLTVALIFYFNLPHMSSYFSILAIAAFLMLIYIISVRLIRDYTKAPIDKPWIVIDEVMGMTVSLLPALILQNKALFIPAFIAFRFFDIVKPGTIKHIDSLHTPQSVLLDDILSGILSALLLIFLSPLL